MNLKNGFNWEDNQSYKTPDWFKLYIESKYWCALSAFDPCPYVENWDPQVHPNGLNLEWQDNTFCNPPFNDANNWIKKAIKEKNKGKRIFILVPRKKDTNTQIWKDILQNVTSYIHLPPMQFEKLNHNTNLFEPHPQGTLKVPPLALFCFSPIWIPRQNDFIKKFIKVHGEDAYIFEKRYSDTSKMIATLFVIILFLLIIILK